MVLALGLAACSGRGDGARSDDRVPSMMGAKRVPDESLTDWVSYGDHLALVTVTGDRMLPVDPATRETGEGIVGREIDVRIDRMLWSRDQAPRLPEVVSFNDVPYAYEHGKTTPMTFNGTSGYQPRERYLMLLTCFVDGCGAIGPRLPYDGSKVQLTADDRTDPWGRSIGDRTPEEIGVLLRRTEPYPKAKEAAALDAEARYAAVRGPRRSAAPEDPEG